MPKQQNRGPSRRGQAAVDSQQKRRHMKIAVMKFTITTIAVVLGAARAVAGPAPTGWGGTNVCNTSLTSQLSQYDADGDGTISSNEFASAGEDMVQALQSRSLARYDTDHDGSVT